MDTVRIGVLGAGNMGSSHIQSLLEGKVPGLKLTAVADRKPARLEWLADTLKEMEYKDEVATFSEAADLIHSAAADAVIIAVPHYQHPPLAIMALKAGLHVMCEKPAGVYTKAVREMNAVAESSGKVFAIMFNQRTNCVYRAMRDIVQSGEMGAIRRSNWLITNWYRSQSYYDSGAWRATWAGEGGGVLLNQCPHNLDLWQWICGMPVKVRAFTHNGKWHDIEVEDDVTAYVEYENGATGVFITSTGDTPGTNRFEVLMDGGKLVCDGEKLIRYDLETPEPEFTKTYTGGFGEPEYTQSEVETDGENPQHVGVLAKFADAILNGGSLVAPGTEGIRGLTLSNAMHLSSWLDKTVELPLDEDLFLEELKKRQAVSRHKEDAGITLSTEGSYGSKAKDKE
ncbi:MAG: Gfo/Idh/MocA family oxidoreductase [Oscillospiraceae bacterium]|jgi:predicted dehydrogenase|nr:Gfo/Idh/MocA family oxidoreductase [Oscillospiraceae bacterium]